MTDRLTNDELHEHIRTALGGVGPQQTKRIMKVTGFLLARLNQAEACVAELEAAARWHRGTAKPPGPAWYFVYDLREDDTPLRRYHNGAAWGLPGEEEEPPDWWLPIPPLPQETTP